MTIADREPVYCSDISLQAGEPLYGSATQTQVFLLLEYTGAWGQKALEQSDIPEIVKARLKELGKQVPASKTLLIKTTGRQRRVGEIRFFVATLSPPLPQLYAFELAEYSALLELDIPAVLAGNPAYDANLHGSPLYLVCVNGRRDLCCARHGLAVFNALEYATRPSPEPLVWQCSHVGGHRFAANLICLPHGLLYGRVRPETALAILEADRLGRIYLPNLRGRVNYLPVAQAAEYFLHRQRGVVDIDAFHLSEVRETSAGEWLVSFETQPVSERLAVSVRVGESGETILESCGQERRSAVIRYEFQLMER